MDLIPESFNVADSDPESKNMVELSPIRLLIKNIFKVFQDEREKHGSILIGLKKTVDESQSVLTIAQNELTIYTSAAQKEKIRLEQLKNSISSTKDQLKDKGARLEELKTEVPAKEKELLTSQREAQKVRKIFISWLVGWSIGD